MSDWCTIESDPGVFTELIEKVGIKGIGVEEVYSLHDEGLIKSLGKIHGFIFLFKYQKETKKKDCLSIYDNELFFAHQVVTNACATQAILSILMNVPELELGEELGNYKSFAMALDPNTRGQIIGDLNTVKNVHNSFARPEPFVYEGKRPVKDGDDVYHFVSYIEFKGKVYELDGLQQGPIMHGDAGDDWVNVAKNAINQRIQEYAQNEIRFNLLAVVESKDVKAKQQIADLKKNKGKIYNQLQEIQGENFNQETFQDFNECTGALEGMESGEELDVENLNEEQLQSKLNDINSEIQTLNMVVEDENKKRVKYQKENVRRRHNYIPMILELLKIAAEKGELKGLYDSAVERKQAVEANKKKKE